MYLTMLSLMIAVSATQAQSRKVNYHPCFLLDSVDQRLAFIKQNAARVFTDSADCKETLLDSITGKYVLTKDFKYLDALAVIRQNPAAKADGLFTDVITLIVKDDFIGFADQLYRSKGRLLPLQNELIGAMNIIVDGRPFKQKYMGLLNVEIERTKGDNDKYRLAYLEKLKLKINEEKYR